MQVVADDAGLEKYLQTDAVLSAEFPVVVSKFHQGCFEADLDAIAQNGKVLCYGIADHVELAGTHSGDAHMVLPPHRLSSLAQQRVLECGEKLAKALNISGPFNSQFIITPEEEVLVIECNVRGSRSLPFMSKTLKQDMVATMARVLLGKDQSHVKPVEADSLNYVGVKVPQFSWTRLKGADPRCGVEMASTGEVATFGPSAEEAFLKSVNSTHIKFPKNSVMFSAIQKEHVEAVSELAKDCVDMGYEVIATELLADALAKQGVACRRAPMQEAMSILEDKGTDYVISIPSIMSQDQHFEMNAHYRLRRRAVDYSIPVTSELENARMLIRSLKHMKQQSFSIDAYSELPQPTA
jgi:hypothetical protein